MFAAKCLIPRFAQIVRRCGALTTNFVPKQTCRPILNRNLSVSIPKLKKETVKVHFELEDGTKLSANGKVGDNILDIVIDNDLDLDGFGACEGTLACSTCHVILKQADFDKLPSDILDEELDMLDLAYGLTDTSRLGCQVCVTKDIDGLTVRVPAGVADAREPS